MAPDTSPDDKISINRNWTYPSPGFVSYEALVDVLRTVLRTTRGAELDALVMENIGTARIRFRAWYGRRD